MGVRRNCVDEISKVQLVFLPTVDAVLLPTLDVVLFDDEFAVENVAKSQQKVGVNAGDESVLVTRL